MKAHSTLATLGTLCSLPLLSASAQPLSITPAGDGSHGPVAHFYAPAPSDLAGNPLATEVQRSLDAGLIQAYRDNTFRPEAPITRLETALLLTQTSRVLAGQQLPLPSPGGAAPYPDIEAGSPFIPMLTFVSQQNLMTPFSDGLFRPNEGISRAYYSAALYKTLKLVLATLRLPALETVSVSRQTFPDTQGHWSNAYASTLSGFCGAAFSTAGTAFEPDKGTTRAWAAVSALRAFECVRRLAPSSQPPVTPQPPPATTPAQLEAPPVRYGKAQELSTMISTWAAAAPSYLQTVTYGSANGYEQKYLRISRAVSTGEQLPRVLVTAGTHGDEWTAVGALTQVLHKIAAGYNSDPEITNLVNTRDLYFVLTVCPQSYDRQMREAEGQDPNRSFPIPGRGGNGRTPACIQNIMNLFGQVGFHATLDLHNLGDMLLLPWGYTRQRFSDGNNGQLYQQLGGKIARNLGYRMGQISQILYEAPGGSVDYFYAEGKTKGWNTCAMGAEIGSSKRARENQIPQEAANVFRLVLDFSKDAPVLFNGGSGYGLTQRVKLPALEDVQDLLVTERVLDWD